MQKINQIKSISYKITIIFLTIIALILTGCGFKPRSQATLPPQLHKIYLQTDNPFGQFENAFRKSLKASGITVLDQPNATNLTLFLAPTTFSSENHSIGGSIQARVYNLSLTVKFKIIDGKGTAIIDTQTITVNKGLTLSPNEVFSASNQVDLEKQTIQQEAIVRIFNILGSKRTKEILNFKSKI